MIIYPLKNVFNPKKGSTKNYYKCLFFTFLSYLYE